jgi:hypothetical protein
VEYNNYDNDKNTYIVLEEMKLGKTCHRPLFFKFEVTRRQPQHHVAQKKHKEHLGCMWPHPEHRGKNNGICVNSIAGMTVLFSKLTSFATPQDKSVAWVCFCIWQPRSV